jgi:energy-converting hydrogenase Eha subunit B
MFENVPMKWAERGSRLLQIGLVGLSLGVPCVFCAATFPGARAPYVLGGVAAGLILAGLVCAFWRLRADPELLFGCLTTFAALMTVATFVSVFARQQVENESAWTFLAMAALSVVALSLIAHDWARRQLLIAAPPTSHSAGYPPPTAAWTGCSASTSSSPGNSSSST